MSPRTAQQIIRANIFLLAMCRRPVTRDQNGVVSFDVKIRTPSRNRQEIKWTSANRSYNSATQDEFFCRGRLYSILRLRMVETQLRDRRHQGRTRPRRHESRPTA